MGWQGHKGTFFCPDHPKLTVRARRWRLSGYQSAPRCRTCGSPMRGLIEIGIVREYGRIVKRKFLSIRDAQP